ncbi:hypothetical protein O3P69_004634 [Scylla paramamosain]|uniref:BESS domain-containing protein n=2 Tax=Scylla paramamosain TaxID=85552 RepID=A0AAW0UAG2_SCYPA
MAPAVGAELENLVKAKVVEELDNITSSLEGNRISKTVRDVAAAILPGIANIISVAVSTVISTSMKELSDKMDSKIAEMQQYYLLNRYENDKLEQYSRRENLRILVLEKEADETEGVLEAKIFELAGDIGVKLKTDDISVAHRLRKPREGESPQIEYQMGTMEPPLATEEGVSHTKDALEREDEVMEKQWLISPATRPKKKGANKRSKTDDFNQSILDIEQQKIQYLKEKINRKQDKEDDEDLMFFKSLLPHVKRIPAVQKLTFRSRLQELVQQFAYPVPAISPLPYTHDSSSSASAYTPQVSPHSYAHSPIESQVHTTDMTLQPM